MSQLCTNMAASWVEETMKDSDSFDATSVHKGDDSRKDRLRYWNDELCRKKPHTFDIVIAVRYYQASIVGTSLNSRFP